MFLYLLFKKKIQNFNILNREKKDTGCTTCHCPRDISPGQAGGRGWLGWQVDFLKMSICTEPTLL